MNIEIKKSIKPINYFDAINLLEERLNDLYDLSATNILYYEQVQQHITMMDNILDTYKKVQKELPLGRIINHMENVPFLVEQIIYKGICYLIPEIICLTSIVIFLHSNQSYFSLLLSSIISFTRGEVGVSSSAFPFTLHWLWVHRDQEAKIFRHSVQQVPSQKLNELESGNQLLVGTGDNYTDTVISMESFATHVKEEALKF